MRGQAANVVNIITAPSADDDVHIVTEVMITWARRNVFHYVIAGQEAA